MEKDKVIGGIMGVMTGDALGLPVQFLSREEVRTNPVCGMRSGGTYNTPEGCISDDGSLTLCLTISLSKCGYDLQDIADRFVRWYKEGYCTPLGFSFDIGRGTMFAMENLIKGIAPLDAGPAKENNNGNGSLMRILPASIYFSHLPDSELITRVCEISKITHGHPRSQLGCALYSLFVKALLSGENPEEAYETMCLKAQTVFADTELAKELIHYTRVVEGGITNYYESEIKSSGYIVDALEAAIWCFLTTNNFQDAVLTAVNLGLDTDSIGAVTGGLAGVYYGLAGIPEEWLSGIIKKDLIIDVATNFAEICAYC